MDYSIFGPQSDAVIAFLAELSEITREDIYRGLGIKEGTLDEERSQVYSSLGESDHAPSESDSNGGLDFNMAWLIWLGVFDRAEAGDEDLVRMTGVTAGEWRAARRALDRHLHGKLSADGLPEVGARSALISLIVGDHKISRPNKATFYEAFRPFMPRETLHQRTEQMTRYGSVWRTVFVEGFLEVLQNLRANDQELLCEDVTSTYYGSSPKTVRRQYALRLNELLTEVRDEAFLQPGVEAAMTDAQKVAEGQLALNAWSPPAKGRRWVPLLGSSQKLWSEAGWLVAMCRFAAASLAISPWVIPERLDPLLRPFRTLMPAVVHSVDGKESMLAALMAVDKEGTTPPAL